MAIEYDIEMPITLTQVQGGHIADQSVRVESFWGSSNQEPYWVRILLRDPQLTRKRHRWLVPRSAIVTGIDAPMEDVGEADAVDDVRFWQVDVGRIAMQLWSEDDGSSLFLVPRKSVSCFLRRTARSNPKGL